MIENKIGLALDSALGKLKLAQDLECPCLIRSEEARALLGQLKLLGDLLAEGLGQKPAEEMP